jgi:hypothetical protein
MKNLCVILLVIVAGRATIGCSDDGVYTPVEYDAGTDAHEPAQACSDKLNCPDGG